MENKQLFNHAQNMRKNILKMVHNAKSGHPGGSMSAADLISVLYFEEMNINKENVGSIDRDKFVLSKGHASPLLFAVLCEKGLLDEQELLTFRKINSRLQGHPNMNYVQGVDMSTGSLGQGISAAVGMALGNKVKNNDFNVYALLGDGEIQEGQVWEAFMSASHFGLDNLCVIIDNNDLQIDGDVRQVMNPHPIDDKLKAFGFEVEVIDGHDYDQIKKAYQNFRNTTGKPYAIIAKTVKGKGVSFMENQAGWHGVAPSDEQLSEALKELDNE